MITSRIMDRRRLEIIALVLISLLTFICWETTARLFWKNAPQLLLPFSDDIFMKVDDPDVYYALKPGERFYYQGAAGFINRKGMRGREITIPKPKNTFRVVMTGDETVFGPGLREDKTLPARLQEELKKISGGNLMNVEVINAGVPEYGFFNSAALLKHVAALQPDLVLIVISEDDFEIQGVGGDGRTPSAVTEQQHAARRWMQGIGTFMLPDKEARFRYFVANASRGYLMAAMFMKGTHGNELTGVPAEIRSKKYKSLGSNYPANSSSCQADRMIWGRVEKALVKVSAATDGGFGVAGVMYSDFSLRGREAIRIHDAFEKAGISLINLSVYRKNEDAEKKEHNLQWINYPNAAAQEENGKLLAGALQEMKLLKGFFESEVGETGAKYEKLASVRKNMYWELVNGQEVRDRIERNDFRVGVDFSTRGANREGQILYGWWPPAEMAWMGRPELAWVSDSASVILRKPKDADTLHVEGGIYPPAVETTGGLRVTFSFECMKPETTYIVHGSFFEADVPIPPGLDRREFLEISVDAQNPFVPMEVGGKEGDDRIVSLGVKTMKLLKQDKTEKAVEK